jgi:hypothetical protein
MSVSGLLAGSTLNTIIPSGSVVIPAGEIIIEVPVPFTVWLDGVVQTSWFGFEDAYALPTTGTLLTASGRGTFGTDIPLIRILINPVQDRDVKVFWSVLSSGTVGNNPF